MPLIPELKRELEKELAGEVYDDVVSRVLYSTDASIYQIEPFGVTFPKNYDDIAVIVSLAKKYQTPIVPRGAGSSLAGQAVGKALIVDFSRYLNQIIEVNQEEHTVTAEPGVLMTALNRRTSQYGLVFGPDPASADRATVGGSIGNNATGAHSIHYGMTADHLVSMNVVLSDGSITDFNNKKISDIEKMLAEKSNGGSGLSVEQRIYQKALFIRDHFGDTVRQNWPKVWRRASGYNINYLLPWSPSQPDQWSLTDSRPYPPIDEGYINLSSLIAGSEGSLAVIRQVKMNLVPMLNNTILGVLEYDNIDAACDAVPDLLQFRPSAVELIPGELIRLAKSVPAYAQQLTFVQGDPAALLVIEFSGDSIPNLIQKTRQLGKDVLIAESAAQQSQVWNVRKMGLGILNSLPGDRKPYGFIEDIAVPVEKLGEFTREMAKIFSAHGTYANFYAHASAGCLHIRPVISLKTEEDAKNLRSIAEAAVQLGIRLNGAISGEHGDGFARSEWMEKSFGSEIYQQFVDLKDAADEDGLLNPGKIVNAPPMNTQLRYGDGYQVQGWQPFFDFSHHESLIGSIEMCNGAGVCRKDTGLMCPSFQVLQDEMFSPRGRSNLLRAMISGKLIEHSEAEEAAHNALDTCLACKGCKSECPSSVDIAKIKYEFSYQYYKTHPRKIRDYLFGYIHLWAPLGAPFAPLINASLKSMPLRKLNEKVLGLSASREFPHFATMREQKQIKIDQTVTKPDVLFLLDTFSHSFHPETEAAGITALESAGEKTYILPVIGAGRSMISKSFLDKAKAHAARLLEAIKKIDPAGEIPVVGVEPSEIFTLRDEFIDFFPDDEYVRKLAKRSWMIDEYMVRPGKDGKTRIDRISNGKKQSQVLKKVLLHGQCYQKTQPPADDGYPTGASATISMLKSAGYDVNMIESGCCGMAGAFGYEADHYEISMKIGEQAVLPAVRSADDDVIVAASGTSCRSQIKNGTERKAIHPVLLILKQP